MAVDEAWARRQIIRANADKLSSVLKREGYRSEAVFWIALKRCDEISIEVPAQGIIAAKSLCRFGQLISPEIFAMATAVKGSAYRILGRFDKSRESYEKSLEIASKPTVVRGRILQRFAVLEFDLVKNATARKRINESLELLESEEDTAISLIIRANIDLADGQYLECLQSAGFALRSLNPKHHQRAYLAGIQVLGRGILAGGASSEDISAICRVIQDLKRNRPRRRSVCWLYLDLVEAQIYARLGSHRQAERQFLRVRERLFEAGGEHFREGLLVSLDLAVLYEDCGEFRRSRSEAESALEIAEAYKLDGLASTIRVYLSREWLSGLERDLRGIVCCAETTQRSTSET